MEFNYYGADYKRFEQGFTSVYAGIEPLFSIVDDLERVMNKGKPYFILPANQAKDGMQHVFYFEVVNNLFEYKNFI